MAEMIKSLNELYQDYEQEKRGYEDAAEHEAMARQKTTAAMNRMNAAQKAIDDAITELKRHAPQQSNWRR